jgi:hypothetical protein
MDGKNKESDVCCPGYCLKGASNLCDWAGEGVSVYFSWHNTNLIIHISYVPNVQ